MLIEETLFWRKDKVKIAIERLKEFEPEEGYYLAFSGGKDSVVIKELAIMAGVKFDAHHSLTTIDPPELMRFIFEHHKDVKIERPEVPFLRLLPKRGFPQRQGRWCCAVYKENGGAGRKVVTGLRWAESVRRGNRRMTEVCFKDKMKTFLNVIIDWTEEDVWQFIRQYKVPYCCLYDQGQKRVGCLFCPMATTRRLKDVERYPQFVKLYIKAFEELYANRKAAGAESIKRWNNGEEMFWWWIKEDRTSEENPDQTVMFE
jgi:phosphoadenosine phosphosulfate reductase